MTYELYLDKEEIEIIRNALSAYVNSPWLGMTGMPYKMNVEDVLKMVEEEIGEESDR